MANSPEITAKQEAGRGWYTRGGRAATESDADDGGTTLADTRGEIEAVE